MNHAKLIDRFIFYYLPYVFKNIKDIMLWSCKFITAAYIWLLIWITTQIQHLPEWQTSFSTSTAKLFELINITKKFDL